MRAWLAPAFEQLVAGMGQRERFLISMLEVEICGQTQYCSASQGSASLERPRQPTLSPSRLNTAARRLYLSVRSTSSKLEVRVVLPVRTGL